MGPVPRASLLLLGLLAAVGVAAAPAHRTMGPVPRAPLLLLGLLSTVGVAAAAAPTVAPSVLPTPIPSPMPSPVPTALFSGRKKSSSDDYSTAQTVAAVVVTIFAFVVVGILGVVVCASTVMTFFRDDDKHKHKHKRHEEEVPEVKEEPEMFYEEHAQLPDVQLADADECGESALYRGSKDDSDLSRGYDEEVPESIGQLMREGMPTLLCKRFPTPGEGGDDSYLLGCAALNCEADLADQATTGGGA